MRDRRQQLRRLLGLCSACRAAAAISHVHTAILKDSVLNDSEAAAALEDALGPEPWQLRDPATMATIQKHIHEAAERMLETLYADHPIEESHVLSTADIDKHDGDISSLTYGEVEFAAFSEVLQIAKGWCGGSCKKFYDLGSGAGRAVFTAALNIDFEELVGIEVLEGLCGVSKAVRQKFDQSVARALNMPRSISFVHGDVLDPAHSWADGDVVFANSTCFDAGLMDGIAARAEQLRPGAVLITFSMAIRSLWFKVVYKKRYTMSWGPATVFIHVKLDEEGYQTRLKEGTEYDNDQDVVYPSAASDRRGSDTDSLKVYFSETSSLHDGTERSEYWAFPAAGSEAALEDDEEQEEDEEEEEDHAACDEEPDAKNWECPANEQIDDGCLSPSEEALYEQVRRGEQSS